MFKKLILSLVLFLFMTTIAIGECTLLQGTRVLMFVPIDGGVGVQEVYPNDDIIVSIHKEQPTEKQLKKFSLEVSENWTDGVVVNYSVEDVNIMVHRKDLICE